jgi:hypothetical protein
VPLTVSLSAGHSLIQIRIGMLAAEVESLEDAPKA